MSRLHRRGKVFSLGMFLIYLIACLWALWVVYSQFLTAGVEGAKGYSVGDYQGAMLGAYERADRTLSYLDDSASLALDETARLLYTDAHAFFTRTTGDTTEGLACGTYAYQLWNDKGASCLLADPAGTILAALTPKLLEALGRHALAYPGGGLVVAYLVEPAFANGTLSVAFRSQERLEEPIVLGLDAAQDGRAAAQAFSDALSHSALTWPSSASTTITSCFGPRKGVAAAAADVHEGMDIAPGGFALAAADGVVLNDPSASRDGTVWIRHDGGLSTRYLHLKGITVKAGDAVKRGQALGTPSDTGCAAKGCGPHLHFEVLVRDLPAGAVHAYASANTPGWVAINPACLFDGLSDGQVAASATQSCLAPGYPKPAVEAYCGEYGLSLTPAVAFQQGTRIDRNTTTQDAALGAPQRPDASSLTQRQQAKFHTTELNRARFGWDVEVVRASAATGVPQPLLLGVITQESLGDPSAISHTGCAGIMQWCIDNKDKASSTAATFFGSPAYLTSCACAGRGPSCKCTPENDRRLVPAYAIPAGASLLKALLATFSGYADQERFAVAAYNVGEGVVQHAINGVGGSPSWDEVAKYLTQHPELIAYFPSRSQQKAKVAEVTGYVGDVMAFAAAWNGGVLPARGAPVPGVTRIGSYTYDPSLAASSSDYLAPYVALVTWANRTLATCKDAPDPGVCLEQAAAAAGVSRSCEDAPVDFFVSLYEALRDCAENGQDDCQCAMPPTPAYDERSLWRLSVDPDSGDAVLAHTPSVGAPRTGFPSFSGMLPSFLLDVRGGIVPDALSFDLKAAPGLATSLELAAAHPHENLNPFDDASSWPPGWVAEKQDGAVVFREEASGVGQCAPVKTRWAFCKEVVPGLPPVKFALTLIDETPPDAVTGLAYDNATRRVSFVASASVDVSFYNVYDADPSGSSQKPLLQVRGATAFDAAAYAGRTLYLAAVDKAGNEGEAASVSLPG